MPTKAQVKKHFAQYGATAPAALEEFIQFADQQKEFFSGCFEPLLEDALAWFNDDAQAAAQFIGFGQNADGGSYAYWLHDGLPVEKAPIVYLGSEGGGNVLAGSTEDFLRLLAVGADELGVEACSGGLAPAAEPAPGLKAYRQWLQATLGLDAPPDPDQLIEKAQAGHPCLGDWISDWQNGGPKSPAAARPDAALARWDDVATLHHLFGVPDNAPELKAFLKEVGGIVTDSSPPGKQYSSKDKGFVVSLKEESQGMRVWGFYLCGRDCQGFPRFNVYPGKLPQGFTWSDKRAQAPAKLGAPHVNPARDFIRATDIYLMGPYRLDLGLAKDDESKIDTIWVGEP